MLEYRLRPRQVPPECQEVPEPGKEVDRRPSSIVRHQLNDQVGKEAKNLAEVFGR